ncbi:penicillin-binding [Fusarium longipes]|uniref:Penicillin-binding n=1 Tax=Fusarium longipes TaxID=694270 RepID=A0A395SDR9_9HYPO|nr:penicillin-binding [Fusarium longipes]
MRLKILVNLLGFLPSLLHAQADEADTSDVQADTSSGPTEAHPAVGWYINKNAASHASHAKELRLEGFRPMSLSAYGNPGATQYAATWINDGKASQPWQMAWGLNKEDFDDWVAKWRREGYRLIIVSANGPAGNAEFHGVTAFSHRNIKWNYACDIEDLEKYMAEKDSNGISKVVSFRMYGEVEDRRYCVVLHENEGNERWSLDHSESGVLPDHSWISEHNYPQVSRQFLRPHKLFISDDGVTTPLTNDLDVGGWSAAVHLNLSEMVKEIKRQGQQWFLPVDIQGCSGYGRTEFNAVFAERMKPQPRTWAAQGNVSGFRNSTGARKELDRIMEKFMNEHGIRQAQVAIGARGYPLVERSYTWAELPYATVHPDDVFLLGGVSKMFLNAAIQWCIDELLITLDTPVYKLLGYRNACDSRVMDITIQHLLDHTAGYDRKQSGEGAFEFGKVGLKLSHNGTDPATLHDLIKYKLKQKLDSNPGERFVYSHYGSMLLGAVVANLTEMPYVDFLKKHILDGLDVSLFETASEAHSQDKIVQEGLQIGIDARYPAKKEYVPGVYGGDGAIKEECAAAFSLRASATSLIKFAAKHSVARIGKRRNGYRRGGIEGGYAYVESHGDFDWALVFNTREFASKNAVLDLAHNKIRQLVVDSISENHDRYGPYTLTCNPGPEILTKSYPGLEGVSLDEIQHLPDCTEEELDEIMHYGAGHE